MQQGTQQQLDQLTQTTDPSSLTQLDPSTLQSLLGASGGSLIPEELVSVLTFSFILLNVLGVAIAIMYLIGMIRKWRVQSAVLHMQKDVAEIKQALIAKQPIEVQSKAIEQREPAPVE